MGHHTTASHSRTKQSRSSRLRKIITDAACYGIKSSYISTRKNRDINIELACYCCLRCCTVSKEWWCFVHLYLNYNIWNKFVKINLCNNNNIYKAAYTKNLAFDKQLSFLLCNYLKLIWLMELHIFFLNNIFFLKKH